jgi:hypothetical protein
MKNKLRVRGKTAAMFRRQKGYFCDPIGPKPVLKKVLVQQHENHIE